MPKISLTGSKRLTKEEVAGWIRTLVPYLENPMYLAPKGCLVEKQKAEPGAVITYDAALMPKEPEPMLQSENLKALVELYQFVSSEDCEFSKELEPPED